MNFGVDDNIVFCLHMSLFCLYCQYDSQQFIAPLISSGFVIACCKQISKQPETLFHEKQSSFVYS